MPDAAFFSESIPFFALVYHGIILYNPSTDTVNFPIKDKKQMLKLIEYGRSEEHMSELQSHA